jgi:hypothetical protein
MLLHGNGTNGAQNNTFVDSSTNNFSITRNGNTTQGTFSPYGSNWSNYFDGTDDLRISTNAAFAIGTGNFTFEAWINPPSWASAAPFFVCTGTGGLWIGKNGSNFVVRAYGVADQLQYATLPTTNVWTHIVAVRSGTTLSLFYNGTRVATTTNVFSFVQQPVSIGSDGEPSAPTYYTGYISNLRLVKGTAVYDPTASTLTVPTAPLTAITNTSLLTCADNRFIDDSTNNFTITKNGDVSVQRFSPFSPTSAYTTSVIGGSGYFDGTGDALSAPASSAIDFGTSNFTIEAWVYLTSGSAYRRIFSLYGSAGVVQVTLRVENTNTIRFYTTTSGIDFTSTATIPLNAWSHIAVVRNGSAFNLYLNGVSIASATSSSSMPSTSSLPCFISGYDSSNELWLGYISDSRIVKGTAVYTSAFTPPTAPLTAITNTSLLLSYTNAAIIDNSMMNDWETVGNAQISTSVKKYGTGSMLFDGTGDYLFRPSSSLYDFGTGDFTIEMWIYRNGSQAAYAGIIGFSVDSGNGLILGFGNADNKLRVVWNNTQTILASSAMTNTTWTHVALVRSGATVTCYQDGTSVGTYNISTNAMPFTGAGMVIGRAVTNTDSYYFNGYIDDLRITKGVARYTANFTAPTAPFPDKG